MRMWSSLLVVGIVASLCGSGYGNYRKNGWEEGYPKNEWDKKQGSDGPYKDREVRQYSPRRYNNGYYEHHRDNRNEQYSEQHEKEHRKDVEPWKISEYDHTQDLNSRSSSEDHEYNRYTGRTADRNPGPWNWKGDWDRADGEGIDYYGQPGQGGGRKPIDHNNDWAPKGKPSWNVKPPSNYDESEKTIQNSQRVTAVAKNSSEKVSKGNGDYLRGGHHTEANAAIEFTLKKEKRGDRTNNSGWRDGERWHGDAGKYNEQTDQYRRGNPHRKYDESKKIVTQSVQYATAGTGDSSKEVSKRNGGYYHSKAHHADAIAGSTQITQENQNRVFKNC